MQDKNLKYKALALAWTRATPRLRAIQHAEIRRENNGQPIESLNSLFREMIRKTSIRRTSGLVEMYKVLKRRSGQ